MRGRITLEAVQHRKRDLEPIVREAPWRFSRGLINRFSSIRLNQLTTRLIGCDILTHIRDGTSLFCSDPLLTDRLCGGR